MESYILLANASAFDAGVETLRWKLFPLAFILVILGIWESGWKGGSDPRSILGILLKTTIIVVLLAFFPAMMKGGKEAFDGLKDVVSPGAQNRFTELLEENLPEVEVWNIGPYIASLIVIFLQFWGLLGIKIVKFFQEYSTGCLTAVSPLMIGLLAVSYTQAIGIRFLMTSLCVVMWSLGFVFVDLFLSYLGTGVLTAMLGAGVGATIGGILTVVGWPVAIGTMLVAALVPTFLYVATPMAITKLMAGANAGTAAAWAGLSNMATGAQHVSRSTQIASQLRSATSKTTSTEGSIPRPPNPIV